MFKRPTAKIWEDRKPSLVSLEGDQISVAFPQDGKTVVYDTTVNAYGNLGLVFMRNATSKETTALAELVSQGNKPAMQQVMSRLKK